MHTVRRASGHTETDEPRLSLEKPKPLHLLGTCSAYTRAGRDCHGVGALKGRCLQITDRSGGVVISYSSYETLPLADSNESVVRDSGTITDGNQASRGRAGAKENQRRKDRICLSFAV